MCGRYNLGPPTPQDELRKILREVDKNTKDRNLLKQMKTEGEIFPTNIVPIITPEYPQAMMWGFPIYGGKMRSINVRDDSLTPAALESWSHREFKEILKADQRCLIPVVYYYEWEKRAVPGKKKTESIRYSFRVEKQPLMYIAGVYRVKDVETPGFSIITTTPPEYVAWIHDRMPLILSPEAQKEWLSPGGAIDDVLQFAIKDVQYMLDDSKPQQMDMFAGIE